MKKLFLVLAFGTMFILGGCGNKDLIDTVYRYDKVIMELPNGDIVSGTVQNWTDYDGDQLQIKVNGKTYLVHSSNAVLIKE